MQGGRQSDQQEAGETLVELVGLRPWHDHEPLDLYAFRLADGRPVQLHECDLRDLSYRPGPPPQLTLRFDYDPEWTPRELEATPTIEMRFLDVRIELWEEDRNAYDDVRTHPEWAGEVKAFDVGREPDLFVLDTFTLRLAFRARRIEVTAGPRQAQA